MSRFREIALERGLDNVGYFNNIFLNQARRAARTGDIAGTFTPDFTRNFLEILGNDTAFARAARLIYRDVQEAARIDPNINEQIFNTISGVNIGQSGAVTGIPEFVIPPPPTFLDEFSEQGSNLIGQTPEIIGRAVENYFASLARGAIQGGSVGSFGGPQNAILGALAGAGIRVGGNLLRGPFRRFDAEQLALNRAGLGDTVNRLQGPVFGRIQSLFGRATAQQDSRFSQAVQGIDLGPAFDEFLGRVREGPSTAFEGYEASLRQQVGPTRDPTPLIQLPDQFRNNLEFVQFIQTLLDQGIATPSQINQSLVNISTLYDTAVSQAARQGQGRINLNLGPTRTSANIQTPNITGLSGIPNVGSSTSRNTALLGALGFGTLGSFSIFGGSAEASEVEALAAQAAAQIAAVEAYSENPTISNAYAVVAGGAIQAPQYPISAQQENAFFNRGGATGVRVYNDALNRIARFQEEALPFIGPGAPGYSTAFPSAGRVRSGQRPYSINAAPTSFGQLQFPSLQDQYDLSSGRFQQFPSGLSIAEAASIYADPRLTQPGFTPQDISRVYAQYGAIRTLPGASSAAIAGQRFGAAYGPQIAGIAAEPSLDLISELISQTVLTYGGGARGGLTGAGAEASQARREQEIIDSLDLLYRNIARSIAGIAGGVEELNFGRGQQGARGIIGAGLDEDLIVPGTFNDRGRQGAFQTLGAGLDEELIATLSPGAFGRGGVQNRYVPSASVAAERTRVTTQQRIQRGLDTELRRLGFNVSQRGVPSRQQQINERLFGISEQLFSSSLDSEAPLTFNQAQIAAEGYRDEIETLIDRQRELEDVTSNLNIVRSTFESLGNTIRNSVGGALDGIVDRWRQAEDRGVLAAEVLEQAWLNFRDSLITNFVTGGLTGIFDIATSGISNLLTGEARPFRSALESTFPALGNVLGNIPGFQQGGSISLPGRPGIDSNILFNDSGRALARYTANETLNITPPGQSNNTTNNNYTINLQVNPTGNIQADRQAARINANELSNTLAYINNTNSTERPIVTL